MRGNVIFEQFLTYYFVKVAAQNCRKRKLEQIDELQERLEEAKRREYRLHVEHEK